MLPTPKGPFFQPTQKPEAPFFLVDSNQMLCYNTYELRLMTYYNYPFGIARPDSSGRMENARMTEFSKQLHETVPELHKKIEWEWPAITRRQD
jgi:hypothetical protein